MFSRRLLFESVAESGMTLVERDLTEHDVRTADELFLSSTLKDVHAVVELDGRPVGGGAAGPITTGLIASFEEFCEHRSRDVYAPRFAAI